MVARREQGAVGNVSKGEWGNSKEKRYHKLKNSWKKVVENGKELSGGCMGEHLFHPRLVTNGHGCWYGDTQKWAVLTIARVGGCKGESRRTGWF